MPQQNKPLQQALAAAESALRLIATPARPDGTYNREREACEHLAREALQEMAKILTPALTPVPAPVASAAKPLSATSKITVYTDGGCHGNPGPAGWGAVLVQDGKVVQEAGGFIGHATNQIAELMAAIEGLTLTPQGADVELVSDSQYMLKGLTEWRKGWERKGFKTAAGSPVANLDYWQRLYALADTHKVTPRWVRGHNGDPFNERCDVLATQAIKQRAAV